MITNNLKLSGLYLLILIHLISSVSNFKFNLTPLNEEFISKDISEIGLKVNLDEFDFIPREVSIFGKNREICKQSLKFDYQNDVYGLSDHFGCDIRLIASKPCNNRIYPFSAPPDDVILPITGEISEEDRKKCTLAKLAALCSSYLRFSNCIYTNYVEGLRSTISNITIEEKALSVFKDYPNTELINNYNSVAGGLIGFIFREYLQKICSFLHNSCPSLHPQLNGQTDYFLSQSCSVFDIITPLKGYDQIFKQSVDSDIKKFKLVNEINLFIEYQQYNTTELIFSQFNIPLGYSNNRPLVLKNYTDKLLENRCLILQKLYENSNDFDLYTSYGKYRIYAACFQVEKYYGKCDFCHKLGIKNNVN